MKKRTTVRSHLRKTKRGPKIIRRHPRLVRARMADWESERERRRVKSELEEIRREKDSYPEGFLAGVEYGLESIGLKKWPDRDPRVPELKPFKRSKMQRARMAIAKLPHEMIEELASRPKVKRIAVENFLGSLEENPDKYSASVNLDMDARMYKWNPETVRAIREGINRAKSD